MRTTVVIDDELLEEAQRRAAAEGATVDELVTHALRAWLARRSSSGEQPYKLLTYGDGPALPGIDITNNAAVRDAMDEI